MNILPQPRTSDYGGGGISAPATLGGLCERDCGHRAEWFIRYLNGDRVCAAKLCETHVREIGSDQIIKLREL